MLVILKQKCQELSHAVKYLSERHGKFWAVRDRKIVC